MASVKHSIKESLEFPIFRIPSSHLLMPTSHRPQLSSRIKRLIASSLLGNAMLLASAVVHAEDSTPSPSQGVPIVACDRGIQIDGGTMGKLVFSAPIIRKAPTDRSGEKPTGEAPSWDTSIAHYPSGAEFRMVIAPDHKSFTAWFSIPPKDMDSYFQMIRLPIKYKNGGQFGFGPGPLQAFPAQPDKEFIAEQTSGQFRLVDPSGVGFTLSGPENREQMQDVRAMSQWSEFTFRYFVPLIGDLGKKLTFTVEPLKVAVANAENGKPAGLQVDRFGQLIRNQSFMKVTSEEELQADIPRQKVEMDALPPNPPLDSYGGLPDSGEKYQLKKTGFFRVDKAGGHQVLVDPEGNVFFQLAVCCVSPADDWTLVKGREAEFEWIPPHDGNFAQAWRQDTPGAVGFFLPNWVRKYGKPFDMNEWFDVTATRLRRWGFNSAGDWSKPLEMLKARNIPYTPQLPGDGIPGITRMAGVARACDPFADNFEALTDAAYATVLTPEVNNPLIIGYFLGNEQLFENISGAIPKQKNTPSKLRFVKMLQEKYGNDIEAFKKAWEPKQTINSFDDLKDATLFATTKAAGADTNEFTKLWLETYYSTVAKIFRKYDKNHLLLGSRWQPGTANNETLVKIAGQYLDVISINYYTYGIDSAFLKRIDDWSGGKPMLLSEWHFTATDSGLEGGKEVGSQKERGLGYRYYVENAAALPFVIGSQWFCYQDETASGRWFEGFNGEGANVGFVSLTDRPYTELIGYARQTHDAIYQVMFGGQKPFQFDDPRFTGKAPGAGPSAKKVANIYHSVAGMKVDGSLENWPGSPPEGISPKNLANGPANPEFGTAYRLCWDENNLYVLADVKDRTPRMNDCKGERLWQGDGIELFIGSQETANSGKLLSDRHILIGAGKSPEIFVEGEDSQPQGTQVAVASSKDGYTVEAAIPWKVLGIKPAKGTQFMFDIAIDNSDDGMKRINQFIWNGGSQTSIDHGAWGKAKLN